MMEAPPSILPPENADIVASQCVEFITEFIDVLREEFVLPKRALPPSGDTETDAVRLFSILATNRSFLEKVTEIHAKSFQFYETNDSIHDAAPWLSLPKWDQDVASPPSERSNLIHYILLPLVMSLGYCYEFLDRMVVTPARSEPRRDRPKPPPPVGMLSLKNYTDIACVVEFIICTSVLPFLPQNVLAPLSERVRYHLPKSLAGRIPRSSLLWGTDNQQSLPSTEEWSNLVCIEEWEAVVSVLGRFLLLDRFRPMLLPRHAADIMAVMVYIDAHIGATASRSKSSSFQWVVERWMGDVKPPSTPALDSYWRAKAYQGLLRKGRDAPSWLRLAISQRLTALATRDLLVIITVFVHEAMDRDYSSAALRLAGALLPKNRSEVTMKTEKDDYYCAVCDQLFEVLDSISLNCSAVSPKDASSIETVWAVLNLLPNRIITGYVFESIIQNEMILSTPGNDDALFCSNIRRIVARFCNLFSLPPSTANNSIAASMCSLLFKPLKLSKFAGSNDERSCQISEVTAIGAIVRLASTPSVEVSAAKDDTLVMLRLFVDMMKAVHFPHETEFSESVPGVDVLIVVLVHCLAPCAWDVDSLTFDLPSQNCGSRSHLDPLPIRKVPPNGSPMMNGLATGVEVRANVMIRQVLPKEVNRDDSTNDNQIVFLFFRALLTLYFLCGRMHDSNSEYSTMLQNESLCLVSMVCMPLLCEVCSPESLLSFNRDTDIFDIVKIVLDGALSHFSGIDALNSLKPSQNECQSLGTMAHRLMEAEKCLLSPCQAEVNLSVHRESIDSSSFNGPGDEMILSITAIVLGLLVSVLELGSRTRSKQDEQMLQSLTPSLLCLADASASYPNVDAAFMAAYTQIAEMSSFAAALIASRSIVPDAGTLINDEKESSVGYLVEAGNALRSDLPPLRAQAMVLLRHRANAILEQQKFRGNLDERLIHLEELFEILRLCMEALKDSESYVFLAAIHTIVAVAEAIPSRMVPMIGIAVATGELDLDSNDKIQLCLEQRSKLTEALSFVIRRSSTFHEQLPFLMRLLVVGLRPDVVHQPISVEETRCIRETTHNYFVTDPESSGIDGALEPQQHSREEYWNELDIRIRTGGPVFQTEEGELVRAAMVVVVSELVAVLSSSVTARYASHLVDCCIDMLRLEASRPVRRAGAALSRALYGALLREQEELSEAISSSKPFDVRFSRAVVKSRETLLYSVLQGIVAPVDGTPEDTATVARCREAIQLREEVSEGGILLAGKVALESQQQLEENPIARLLNGKCNYPLIFEGVREL
jgi:Required for nuclear transport of RNA pol II C-terminus 1